jgi:hypothetical protein
MRDLLVLQLPGPRICHESGIENGHFLCRSLKAEHLTISVTPLRQIASNRELVTKAGGFRLSLEKGDTTRASSNVGVEGTIKQLCVSIDLAPISEVGPVIGSISRTQSWGKGGQGKFLW